MKEQRPSKNSITIGDQTDDSDGMGVSIWETVNGDEETLIHSNIVARWFTNKASVPETHRNTWSARGYYLGYAGRNLISTAPQIKNIVFGTFIDGPEYRSPPFNLLPNNITAHYMGSASGFAIFEYGTGRPNAVSRSNGDDWPGIRDRPEGTIVGANWDAAINLTANFNDIRSDNRGSIRGYIGVGGFRTFTKDGYDFHGWDYLKYHEWLGASGDRSMIHYVIELDRANFQSDGTFTGNARMINDPQTDSINAQTINAIRSSSGKWGGKFSNLPNSRNKYPKRRRRHNRNQGHLPRRHDHHLRRHLRSKPRSEPRSEVRPTETPAGSKPPPGEHQDRNPRHPTGEPEALYKQTAGATGRKLGTIPNQRPREQRGAGTPSA